ncbi:hypothetical protein FACS1894188_10590 [Clostridia bacterium]|nr:hypothetical protein FACS1894188_10590 [Clostridia bacterium]
MPLKVKVSMNMDSISTVLSNHGLEAGGRVQQYITTNLIRMIDGYVPLRAGVLKGSRNNAPPYDEIVYDTPYAARLYYNPQYNFNYSPQRGAYWDKRAWADNGDKFLSDLKQAIERDKI